MNPEKHRLIVDGNAFYEIDMECVRQKKKQQEEREKKNKRKGQRN